MKQFRCGDVVPGCMAAFQAEHEQAVLALVEHHEKTDHGMAQVSPSVVEQVRSLTLHLPVAIA